MRYEKRPIYLQIAETFHGRILRGTWAEGERIPSIRDMAEEMEVNPNTMTRTYASLQNQGLIFNKRGIGYFVAEGARDRAVRFRKEEFMKRDLPLFFRKMDSMGVSLEELASLYSSFKSEILQKET